MPQKPRCPDDDERSYMYNVFQYVTDTAEIAASDVQSYLVSLVEIQDRINESDALAIEALSRRGTRLDGCIISIDSFLRFMSWRYDKQGISSGVW